MLPVVVVFALRRQLQEQSDPSFQVCNDEEISLCGMSVVPCQRWVFDGVLGLAQLS